MSDGDFLRTNGPTGREGSVAVRMASGENAAPCWRARGVGGVKAIHAEPGGGHLVEDGRLKVRVSIVAGFFPAVIIAHEENDVWTGSDEGFGFGEGLHADEGAGRHAEGQLKELSCHHC